MSDIACNDISARRLLFRASGRVKLTRSFRLFGLLCCFTATLENQAAPTQSASPSFEVATIKPSPDEPRNKGIGTNGRRLSGINQSVIDMLTFAYEIHRHQVVGAPSWTDSALFDFVGQPGGSGPITGQQWRAMVRTMLMDRFQLALHRETRELPVFALQSANGSSKLKPSNADPSGLPVFGVGSGFITATNVGMADLSHIFQEGLLDRPVVDRTGIPGKFDFTLRWTPSEFERGQRPPAQSRPDDPPPLFQAIQEQLGLKLQSSRTAVDVIVIDHVYQPSPN
jgi:uncharacterized protein (TIGR03435 family)